MTRRRRTKSGIAASGRLRAQTFDVAEITERVPDWPQLSKADRVRVIRSGGLDGARCADFESRNVTGTILHRSMAAGLISGSIPTPDALALGGGWGGGTEPADSAFTASDRNLNDYIDAFSLADAAADGDTFLVDLLLGSLEYQNTTFREWGFRLPNNDLINHGPIYDGNSALEKGDREAALLTATLRFGDAGDVSGGQL